MDYGEASANGGAKADFGLVSLRMIRLFAILRRAGILAQRRLFGLSETEWRIMTQLGETAPLSLNGLAERMMQDRGQLSRAVKAMVERGLLTRDRKPGGPEIEIALSDDGRALYGRMVEWVKERDRALTDGVPAEDVEVVWRVLGTMRDHAQALVEQEQQLGG
jgi:DNA-binding MarR family transcriptional regulator